ncbi:3'-5' exonuclease [Mycolicibacterium moriokaense]|nr:3'-5' exonuclease [Mycolicibacterium moriokaense]
MGGAPLMTRLWRRSRAPDEFDRPWREIDYVVLDLETTGLDLHKDAIASYGATVIRDGRMIAADNVYGLVRPECAMSAKSITIHALRPADLAEAPPLSAAVDVLRELLEGRVLIAHAAWIEQAFLGRAFRQSGHRLACKVVDTAAMARAGHLQAAECQGEPHLEQLATELRLPVDCPHHALGDAITTAHVFLALAGRLAQQGYRTARDFIDLTAGDARLRP